MFYVTSLLIPIAIILLVFFQTKPIKPFSAFVRFYTYSFLAMLLYTVIIYYLQTNLIIDTGWTTYSLIVFMIPAFVLLIVFQLIVYTRKKKRKI